MSSKTLLLLTYYFPPCAAIASHRALGFARHLPRHGWDVAVVAPSSVKWEPNDPALLSRVPPGTRVTRVEFPRTAYARVLGRVMPYEMWLRPAWQAVRRIAHVDLPDVVYTTGPPGCIHYLGYLAKRRFGLPWVACFRDPWITNSVHYFRSDFFKAIETRAEAATMRMADRVLVNTPESLRACKGSYPAFADKMSLLTNGFDPIDPPWRGRSASVRRDTLTLLHSGELYHGRDPNPLMDALKDLHDHPVAGLPKLRLTLLGRDSERLANSRMAVDPNLARIVELKPHVPHAEAQKAIWDADILTIIQGPGRQPFIPGKLYEYLGAGKPVLALAPAGGDVEWVLRTAGVTHRVANPVDAAAIKIALVELAAEIAQGRAKPSDPDNVKIFTREYIARELSGHLDACRRETRLAR